MSTGDEVKKILADALQLDEKVHGYTESTPLLGSVPELDSMAVLAVITSLEGHFGFTIDDDEVSAEMFETLGSLTRFVEEKLRAQRR